MSQTKIQTPYSVSLSVFENATRFHTEDWATALRALAPDADGSGVAGDSDQDIKALSQAINTDDDASTISSREVMAFLDNHYHLSVEPDNTPPTDDDVDGLQMATDEFTDNLNNMLQSLKIVQGFEQFSMRMGGSK